MNMRAQVRNCNCSLREMDLHRTKSNNFFNTLNSIILVGQTFKDYRKRQRQNEKKKSEFPSTLMACHSLTHSNSELWKPFFFLHFSRRISYLIVYVTVTPREVSLIIIIDLLLKFGPKKSECRVRCFRLYLFAKNQLAELMMSKAEEKKTKCYTSQLSRNRNREIIICCSLCVCV